jgi:eukaryotic-like serine/threonine-protein kinase
MARRIGRYEVLAELGRGGFGHVYRCFDPALGVQVAVKTLTAEGDAGMLVRFRNEAATSRKLNHPNIVTIYDFGEQDGMPYIVMELLEGHDLRHVIEARTPLALLNKVEILSQIAAGLGHAHAHGVVHRDVKPANVMLLKDGTVKIMDFGIALITQSTASRLTPRGAVPGTFRYMAPEQFRGGESDIRSDIWAYGLTCYELLSGVHPFYAKNDAAVMYNIVNVEPVALGDLAPECAGKLEKVVSRLLKKDADLRYQDLDDVIADLDSVLLELHHQRAEDLLDRARAAKSQDRLEEARTLVNEALRLVRGHQAAREFRRQIQEELDRRAIRPRVEELVKKGWEAMAAGNPEEAAQRFESALDLDPNDGEIQDLFQGARSAAQRRRDAERLAREGSEAFQRGDHERAIQLAREALNLAPLGAAEELIRSAGAAKANQERQERLNDCLGRARRLFEIRSWDAALELLADAEREFPGIPEIQTLAEKTRAGKEKEEAERELAAGLASAREQFQSDDLSGALERLQTLAGRFPESRDAASMLAAVELEVQEREHREFLRRTGAEGKALVSRREFEAALRVFDSALSRYPADTELQRERQSAMLAWRESVRREAFQVATAQAGELRSRGQFSEAVKVLEACLAEHAAEPAVERLRDEIAQEGQAAQRASELREFLRRAKELIAKGDLETVTLLLQNSPEHVRENSEVPRLIDAAEQQKREEAEKQAALEKLSEEARRLCESNQFESALRAVADFKAKYPGQAGADQIHDRVLQSQHEAQVKDLAGRATALIAGDPWGATALLKAAPDPVREHPEIRELEQAALRGAAIADQSARAREHWAAGRFAEGLKILDSALKSYPGDAQLEALRAEIMAAQAEQARMAARRQLAGRVRDLLGTHSYEEAARLIREAGLRDRANPELPQLESELEAHRRQWLREQADQEVRRGLADVRALLPAHPERAAELLAPLQRKYPGREDIEALAAEVREADARLRRRRLFEQVDELCAKEDFDAALDRLSTVEEDASGELARYRERVHSLKQEAERRREAASRAAAITEIELLLSRGKPAKARRGYSRAVGRFGVDAALEELGGRIEAAARDLARARTGARPKIRARYVVAGIATVAASLTAFYVLSHRPPPPPPLVLVPTEIRTDPDGASVKLGDRSCVTPNCRFNLAPGQYQIRVEHSGYQPVEQALTVNASGRPSVIRLTLNPEPPPPPPGQPSGMLVVRANVPDASVLVDDKLLGHTDAKSNFSTSVVASQHRVRVEKQGYNASPREQPATVAVDKPTYLIFTLTPQPAPNPSGQTARVEPPRPPVVEIPPGPNPPPRPPKVDPAEQAWQAASASSDPTRVRDYINTHPNGPHLPEAQSQLDELSWSRVGTNDAAALRGYIRDFPNGAHKQEAQRRLDDLAWNAVDTTDLTSLQTFKDRNPGNPHIKDAQPLIDGIKRADAERQKQEQARAEQQRQQQIRDISAVIGQFNTAFEKGRAGVLRQIWPSVPRGYTDPMNQPGEAAVLNLRCPTQDAIITEDTATINNCQLTTRLRGGQPPRPARLTMRKKGSGWVIDDLK